MNRCTCALPMRTCVLARRPRATAISTFPRLIAAAEVTGADAIHPGYGFLAENAEFAEICARSDIVFIGPSAEQIRLMGDKAMARKTMTGVGVPTVPGSPSTLDDADAALAVAQEIGFPVLIKAAAGGGGKGMRVATDASVFTAQLQMAQNEARSAFGDASVYLEKYLARPRHIEIQVMGDRHGNIVHLGERECSLQRRHQKLIESRPRLRSHRSCVNVWAKRPRAARVRSATFLRAPSSFCWIRMAASISWR